MIVCSADAPRTEKCPDIPSSSTALNVGRADTPTHKIISDIQSSPAALIASEGMPDLDGTAESITGSKLLGDSSGQDKLTRCEGADGTSEAFETSEDYISGKIAGGHD